MPCDSVYTLNLNLNLGDWELLEKALRSLKVEDLSIDLKNKVASFVSLNGYRTTIRNGKITVVSGDEQLVPEINKAYGRQVVQAAQRRSGAELKQVASNKFKLKLRS